MKRETIDTVSHFQLNEGIKRLERIKINVIHFKERRGTKEKDKGDG